MKSSTQCCCCCCCCSCVKFPVCTNFHRAGAHNAAAAVAAAEVTAACLVLGLSLEPVFTCVSTDLHTKPALLAFCVLQLIGQPAHVAGRHLNALHPPAPDGSIVYTATCSS
jgi:hypothetical protein